MSTESHKIADDIFSRLKRGETIPVDDPARSDLGKAVHETKKLLLKMNATADDAEIRATLSEITDKHIDASVGIFTPLHINYGKNISIGKNVFINFDCVFLDLGGITLEDGVYLAPKVSLLTEGHPLQPSQRHSLHAKPIYLEKNVWIGANATILGGVRIGENSVVAAGSVVTKDVPANVVVAGTPAIVIKQITE